MSWIERHGFSTYGSFNLSQLKIDEAWLNVSNFASKPLWLYQLSSDCLTCPFKLMEELDLKPGASAQFPVSTKFPMKYRFRMDGNAQYQNTSDDSFSYCEMKTSLGEFGIYDLIANDGNPTCELKIQLEPVNIYLPILVAIIFYFLLAVAIYLWNTYKNKTLQVFRSLFHRVFNINTFQPPKDVNKTEEKAKAELSVVKSRLRSLDTFRGLCIIIMIFVHDGGAKYYWMDHATWDGLHVADLVFPWFLWIAGVCIPVSIRSQLKRKTPKYTIFKRILIRSLKMVAIGVMLASKDGPVDIKQFRFSGVLQRFGICYFVGAVTVLLCGNDAFIETKKPDNKLIASIQDILLIWKGWVISLVILTIHTLLTFLLKVPGCPTGYLGPGGLHEGKIYPKHCIGGATGYIDRQVLTMEHIYRWPTALFTYEADIYDPEGILGTLTAIFQVWLGCQAGLTLQVYQKPFSRLLRWGLWAVLTGAIGAALCEAKQTGGLIPVNKNLWSISYVMVTTCFALLLLMALYVIIDIRKWWTGTPFFEPGMNSILLYVIHTVGNKILPFHFMYKVEFNTHFLKLVESLWGITLWVLIAIHLCRKKFFWTV